jgi:hypothetical protein
MLVRTQCCPFVQQLLYIYIYIYIYNYLFRKYCFLRNYGADRKVQVVGLRNSKLFVLKI